MALDGIIDLFTGSKGKKEAISRLSFNDAIKAHQSWRERLVKAIDGTSDELDKLDHTVICKDDRCPLGQWIYNVAADKFSRDEHFHAMARAHANFHEYAGEIVSNVKMKRKGYAQKILDGAFSVKSKEVVDHLKRMQEKYA